MANLQYNKDFFERAVQLLQDARDQVVRTVNHAMVRNYFEIGRLIVEEEQEGKHRADMANNS